MNAHDDDARARLGIELCRNREWAPAQVILDPLVQAQEDSFLNGFIQDEVVDQDALGFLEHRGAFSFVAEDAQHGRELWKSDGTAAGTVMVKDIIAGQAGSSPSHLANVNGVLYFSAEDGVHGREITKALGEALCPYDRFLSHAGFALVA